MGRNVCSNNKRKTNPVEDGDINRSENQNSAGCLDVALMNCSVQEYLTKDVEEKKKTEARCNLLRKAVQEAKVNFNKQLEENNHDDGSKNEVDEELEDARQEVPTEKEEAPARRTIRRKARPTRAAAAASGFKKKGYVLTANVKAGPYKGQQYELQVDEKNKALLGRSTGRKFKLPYGLSLAKDGEVSTTHLEIVMGPTESTLIVRDLNSTNGTIFNGKPAMPGVGQEVSILDSFEVLVGSTLINFIASSLQE